MKRHHLKLVHDAPPDSVGAMPRSEAALTPSGLSPVSRSQAKLPAAIAGPSPDFIRRSRNPDLESPTRFEPTTKREGDIVL